MTDHYGIIGISSLHMIRVILTLFSLKVLKAINVKVQCRQSIAEDGPAHAWRRKEEVLENQRKRSYLQLVTIECPRDGALYLI